jgi:hypothetical protein
MDLNYSEKILVTIPVNEDTTFADLESEVDFFVHNLRIRMLETLDDKMVELFG